MVQPGDLLVDEDENVYVFESLVDGKINCKAADGSPRCYSRGSQPLWVVETDAKKTDLSKKVKAVRDAKADLDDFRKTLESL